MRKGNAQRHGRGVERLARGEPDKRLVDASRSDTIESIEVSMSNNKVEKPAHTENPPQDDVRTTYTTHLHGPVHGPVHTGSGDLTVNGISYSSVRVARATDAQGILARMSPPQLPLLNELLAALADGELREVHAMLAALDAGDITEADCQMVLRQLASSIVARCQGQAVPEGPIRAQIETAQAIIESPALTTAHKVKVILPIVPFLMHYETELAVGSGLDLEKAWHWITNTILQRHTSK